MDPGLRDPVDDNGRELDDSSTIDRSRVFQAFEVYDQSKRFGAAVESYFKSPHQELAADPIVHQGNTADNYIGPPGILCSAKMHLERGIGEVSMDTDRSMGSRIVDLDPSRPYLPLNSSQTSDLRLIRSPTELFRPQEPSQHASGTAPNLSNVRARKLAKPASKDDWVKYRPLITNLYSKMTLGEVMQYMEKEHGFVTS